ncbi:MAG: hypothetical protein NTX00_01775 [Candidatus Parcubacteria bacterium]|nr:hypothetical protein [Candidatus Parcubacteria bacterium]
MNYNGIIWIIFSLTAIIVEIILVSRFKPGKETKMNIIGMLAVLAIFLYCFNEVLIEGSESLDLWFSPAWYIWLILIPISLVVGNILIRHLRQKKKSKLLIIALIVVILIFLWGLYTVIPPLQNKFFPLETKIQAKIIELSSLRERLDKKKQEVSMLIQDYQDGIGEIKDEIRNEQNEKGITTYEQASADHRIKYDLALIQRKQAYIQKLKEISLRLEIGTHELEYLGREAADDAKMAKILRNAETESLVEEINRVIKKYMPDASNLVINIDEKSMQKPEEIWEEIIKGK